MIKAVFFGASSVEGAGASSPEKRFSTLVCRALGWEEVNLGIGGTTLTGRGDDGLIAADDSGIGRVPDILHAKPEVVFISYGANDFALSCPLGEIGRFQPGTFVSDYDTVLRGLIENLPGARLILATCQYRGGCRNAERAGAGVGRLQPRHSSACRALRPGAGRRVERQRDSRPKLRRAVRRRRASQRRGLSAAGGIFD